MANWTADRLRSTWTRFFVERGHTALPSAGLIPHHPRAPLFTNAGMTQFLPYFLGEQNPPDSRVTTIQKCVRIMGKHDDIENIGRSKRHVTFFEMLGNFSFGDYFKAEAIKLAWELSTEVFGFDPELLWVTVHHTDDEAAQLWLDLTSIPRERIQRMGLTDDENFWAMGETGPCGPCSEIHLDRGPSFGPGGGPAHGGDERFLEFWNRGFTQYDRQPDGSLPPLPRRNIDTGAGYERLLSILQGVDSVFDTDLFVPLLDEASSATGLAIGRDPEVDVSLRILADHARSTALLISDGVFPSNEDRGYVLRRLIRRAVRRAYSVGVEQQVMARIAGAVVTEMQGAYPDLARNRDFILQVLDVEESRFRSTLHKGLVRLDRYVSDDLGLGPKIVAVWGVGVEPEQPGAPESKIVQRGVVLSEAGAVVPGAVAFELHDTYGFPIEVTREVAAERGVEVDEEGFRSLMQEQRERARGAARRAGGTGPNGELYRELIEQFGPTAFVGEHQDEATARVLAVLPGSGGQEDHVEVVLDRTPFYAEGGGQVGDTGHLRTETGSARVLDTTRGVPGLTRHHAVVEEGTLSPGQEVQAGIDAVRRDAIRRNHTGTHLLHWALGQVLGGHVKQQGSLVGPDELRFDFSHFSALAPEEIARVEALVNADVLAAAPVVVREMSMVEAEAEGAVAFFGEKYGEVVRVLDAGPHSRELCGGTHVVSTGQIGPLKIVKEESIASNTRRVYATTGFGTLQRYHREEQTLQRAAAMLKAKPEGLPDAIDKVLADRRALQDELRAIRSKAAVADAGRLAATATDGVVVARRDGLDPDGLRQLALAVRDQLAQARAVVLIGSPDGQRVSLVAAVAPGGSASALLAEPAELVGGRGGGKGDVAQAGGKDPAGIDAALERARALLS